MRLEYNSPVILTYALLCTAILILQLYTPIEIMPFFTLNPSFDFANPISYFQLFSHSLGDLFHSIINDEWNHLKAFTLRHPIDYQLVRGNHDILSQKHYDEAGLQVHNDLLKDGPFCFAHEPEDGHGHGYFSFVGHVHPGIRMIGEGKQSLRFPCFFVSENQMILPAFGSFTGLYLLYPKDGDQVFAIVEDQVVRVF